MNSIKIYDCPINQDEFVFCYNNKFLNSRGRYKFENKTNK